MIDDIKYPIAKNETGELVHIRNLKPEYRSLHSYYCALCGDEMIAKCGEKKTHHFAHKNKVSGESTIHKDAKEIIRLKFLSGRLDMTINTFKLSCNEAHACRYFHDFICQVDSEPRTFNLAEYFGKISLEQDIIVDGQKFRADVFLSEPLKQGFGDYVMIEIRYTHELTAQKSSLCKNIIEICMTSDDYLDYLWNQPISISTGARLINFGLVQNTKEASREEIRNVSDKPRSCFDCWLNIDRWKK